MDKSQEPRAKFQGSKKSNGMNMSSLHYAVWALVPLFRRKQREI